MTYLPAASRRGAGAALVLLALTAGTIAAPAASASLKKSLARALEAPGISPSRTGAVAFDLNSSRMVFRRNAHMSFRPASNEKLPVAVAALDRLGTRYRIHTEVLGQGELVAGTWQGRIVLRGLGDPTLKTRDLARLAQRLEAVGIERITGKIVGDESHFDQLRTGPGWKPWYYKLESPPLSALVVDRAERRGRTVDRPALSAARAFRRQLVARGIEVGRRAVTGVARADAALLARVRSATLAKLVRRMNLASDNFIAEMLLKKLGAERRGSGTTADGARVVRRELRQRGVTMGGVRIVDGSGLSDYDRMTAQALVELLISATSDPVIGPAFVASLPAAGVSGTLKDRMETPPARGNVFAKTGTTARASALSGYVRTRWVFAILQNGDPVPWWYARRSQDRFAQVLAGA